MIILLKYSTYLLLPWKLITLSIVITSMGRLEIVRAVPDHVVDQSFPVEHEGEASRLVRQHQLQVFKGEVTGPQLKEHEDKNPQEDSSVCWGPQEIPLTT